MDPLRVDPDRTVSEILGALPSARAALRTMGIDACCGGLLTLRQAAEARGVALADLVASLEAAPGTPPAPPVRSLPVAPPRPTEHPGVVAGFLTLGLVSTLTLGAALGAWNLLVLHWRLGPVPPVRLWIHGGFQVFGFVLPFILGISMHAVPSFFGVPLRTPRWARRILRASVAGLVLWGGAAAGLFGGWGPPGLFLGALLECSAALGWGVVLAATVRRSAPQPEPFHRFLAAGTIWWIVAALLLAAGGAKALDLGSVDAAAAWNEALYAAALFGGALGWIQGMFLRVGATRAQSRYLPPRRLHAAFFLAQFGVAALFVAALLPGIEGLRPLRDAGLLSLALSLLPYLGAVPLRRPRPPRAGAPEDDFPLLLRIALAGGWVFVLLAGIDAAADLLHPPAPHLLDDGMRHAFALGFVAPMIFAVASRVVPRMLATPLVWPRLPRYGVVLMAAGLLGREAEVIAAATGSPAPLVVSGPSGIAAGAGFCLAAASLGATLVAWKAGARPRKEGA